MSVVDIWNKLQAIEYRKDKIEFLKRCSVDFKCNGDFTAHVAFVSDLDTLTMTEEANFCRDDRVLLNACSKSKFDIVKYYITKEGVSRCLLYKCTVMVINVDDASTFKHIYCSRSLNPEVYAYYLTLCAEKNATECFKYLINKPFSKDLGYGEIDTLIKLILENNNHEMLQSMKEYLEYDRVKRSAEMENLCKLIINTGSEEMMRRHINCLTDSYLFTNMNYVDFVKNDRLCILECLLVERKKRSICPLRRAFIPSISKDDKDEALDIIANHASVEALKLLHEYNIIDKNDCKKILDINVSNLSSTNKDTRSDSDSMQVIIFLKKLLEAFVEE